MPNRSVSPIVFHAIMQYFLKFVKLYLPFRPQLCEDIYSVVAISLSTVATESGPFSVTMEVLYTLLLQTAQSSAFPVNVRVEMPDEEDGCVGRDRKGSNRFYNEWAGNWPARSPQ